jgi:DNA helicase IV
VALGDEARTVLGPRRQRRGPSRERMERVRRDSGLQSPPGFDAPAPAGNGVVHPGVDGEEIRSYGHVVIDEVQHLSPMQLRMVARRSLSGSMTAVGDLAQATGPWAPTNWADVTRHLSPRRPPRLAELTVSYRTPVEVVRVATPLLAAAAPGVTPPRPVRRSGFEPIDVLVPASSLAERVAQQARELVAAVAPGRVAVLAPAVLLADIARAMSAGGMEGVDPRDPGGRGLAATLVLLPADEASGLEFDGVVVVEPALVAAADGLPGEAPPTASTRGLRTLYVALTRTTRRLAVVRSTAWPVDLSAD